MRDYFAACVLSHCEITVDANEAAPSDEDIQRVAGRFASAAYIIADAMLTERDK